VGILALIGRSVAQDGTTSAPLGSVCRTGYTLHIPKSGVDEMKRMILALMIASLLTGSASGGVLFPGYIETGGYGTATARISQLGNGEDGVFLGAGGGFIFNRQLMIGADVSFLASDLPYETLAGEDRNIEYALVSLTFTYVFWPDVMIHPGLSFGGGMGWLRLRNPNRQPDENDPSADTLFHGQPAVHVYLNLTRNTRLSISGGYRWVTGVDTEDFIDQDAEGAFVEIAFSFGAF
jgi:hypothetical protein